ncbi:hypothetical protein BVX97_02600 [bacterium E08(2017)]|nr:hypothetical protein BVX97_02600 [bacterium E08(2017)]
MIVLGVLCLMAVFTVRAQESGVVEYISSSHSMRYTFTIDQLNLRYYVEASESLGDWSDPVIVYDSHDDTISATNVTREVDVSLDGKETLFLRLRTVDVNQQVTVGLPVDGSSIDLDLVPIPAGTFMMGSPETEPYSSTVEGPQHEVTISKQFWMGNTEVTVDQFRAFLQDATGQSPAWYPADEVAKDIGFDDSGGYRCPINNDATFSRTGFKYGVSGNQPMVRMSWVACAKFCKWLTERELARGQLPAGYEYRLPTEAEWEYCCRAGSTNAFHYGDDYTTDGVVYTNLGDYAWYQGNRVNKSLTQEVGGKLPNAWGLYDMQGNAEEWCNDWNSHTYYTTNAQVDPAGPFISSNRVFRGVCFRGPGNQARSAFRHRGHTWTRVSFLRGMRVVLAPALEAAFNLSGAISGDVLGGVTITVAAGEEFTTTVTDTNGNYSIPGLLSGDYVVTPSLTGYTFSPTNLNVALSGADTTVGLFVSSTL